MTEEPKRFSWRHWWNYVTIVVAASGVVSWGVGAIDGRIIGGGLLVWLLLGLLVAPAVIYEHLGFADRWVFHDYPKAHQRYRKAVDTKKASPQAYAALASLAYAEGDLAEAARLLEEAATRLPGDGHLHFLLSRVLSRQGRHDEAISEAIVAGKMSEAVLGDLALGSALEGKGDIVSAASAYQRAIEKKPRFIPALLGLAGCYLSLGRIEAARGEVENALKIAPRNSDVLYWAGRIAGAENKLEEADRLLQASLDTRPVLDQAHLVPYRDIVTSLCEARSHLSDPAHARHNGSYLERT